MNARNEFETATNTIEDTLVVEELSDADLMAINGGSPLGVGLGQVGEGLATILNPVLAGLLGLVS